MQMWIIRVDFMSLLVWVPEAPVEQLQHGHTEIQIPRLTKKLLSTIFWFSYSTSFSTRAQSYAVKSPSLAGVAVTVKPKYMLGSQK